MEWWNELISWLTSDAARPTVLATVVLFVAMLASGLLAAWIAGAAIRRLIAQRDHEARAAAISALVDAATEASVWNSLTPQEQVLADRLVGQADIQVRLLPVRGSDVAANWAAHQLHELKRASATFGYQLDPAVVEFRDRLLEWERRPGRTRKQFQNDLLRWRTQRQEPEQAAVILSLRVLGQVQDQRPGVGIRAVFEGVEAPFALGHEQLPGVRRWFERYPYSCIEQKASRSIGLRDAAAWALLRDELNELRAAGAPDVHRSHGRARRHA